MTILNNAPSEARAMLNVLRSFANKLPETTIWTYLQNRAVKQSEVQLVFADGSVACLDEDVGVYAM